MKLSLKNLFYFSLAITLFSSLTLSGFSLYFNSNLIENQRYLLDTPKIYIPRYTMISAISTFFSRQQDILVVSNVEDISRIPEQNTLAQKFQSGYDKLTEISITYPDIKKTLSSLRTSYEAFLVADQQLFELTKSKILTRDELIKNVGIIENQLIGMRNQTENISGKLTLEAMRTQRQVKEGLYSPNLLDSISGRNKFKDAVSELILSNSSSAQQSSKRLNNAFSDLSDLIRWVITEHNPDELKNLENNRLPQLIQLIRNELLEFKTKVQNNTELYQTIVDVEQQFESLVFHLSESPEHNILQFSYSLINKEEKIKQEVEKIQKIQLDLLDQFSFFDTVITKVRDMLLKKSNNIIVKNRIMMGSIVSIILFFLITIGFYLLRTLTNSLNIIINTMKKISSEEGNLSYRIEETPYEDLNEVRSAFNTMASKLQYIHSHLENLVTTKTLELSEANKNLALDLQHRIKMEKEVDLLHQNLMEAARQAGMVDVATSVLHNIGNTLNSVVVSLDFLQKNYQSQGFKNLVSISSMIKENIDNVSHYIVNDEKGKLIPQYLIALVDSLGNERLQAESEIKNLRVNVRHIEDIVVMQQAIGGKSVVAERLFLPDVVEMAIKMCVISPKDGITIEKRFKKNSFVLTDRSKLIQIILNLMLNAKDALTAVNYDIPDKTIFIEIDELDSEVKIVVRDNGSGIPAENLTKIFSFGFTTKIKGHGFGLHSSALSAKELGGSLSVESEGLGKGTAFTLTLPLAETKGDNDGATN